MPSVKLNSTPLELPLPHAKGLADVWISHYAPTGRIAMFLKSPNGEPILTASTNLPNEECPRGEVFVKNWSENDGVAKFLMVNDILALKIEAHVKSGHVTVPRCKFHASVQPLVEAYLNENNL